MAGSVCNENIFDFSVIIGVFVSVNHHLVSVDATLDEVGHQ
jgi:hypothetical protein